MSEPIIKINSLWKVFEKGSEKIEVLRGVNLDIFSGDHISIVGQSGSGKSTFLHVLGTLEAPTSGQIQLGEQDIFSLAPKEIDRLRNEQIGFVFQFHNLLPDHTALRNVALPLMVSGLALSQAEQQAELLLDRVGLVDRRYHKPGELSGGEQQRVAIARALVTKPKLLLADEPTGNLDPKTAAKIMALLLSLHEESGGALVMVTHDDELAQRCPRMLTLVGGQFVESR
jgi:lipoprotein-releasing system ATP-binding protein